MLKITIATVAILGLANAALAADSAPAAQSSEAPQKVKKVCRAEEDTGSMIPRRTCHTREEWLAIDGQAAKNTDTMNTMKHSTMGH